jgi:NADP-dependent 3-hydroxy acid dehydrogenase YdfG
MVHDTEVDADLGWHAAVMTLPQALVVGASSAIGRAIGTELARLGHAVTLWGRRRDALAGAAADCRAVGVAAAVDVVDVTDADQLRRGLGRAADRGPLRTVVWTPGVFDWARADAADPEVWRGLLDVNLTAPAVFTALVAPILVEAAPSTLIYLGSGAGHQAYPFNAAYVASKHGLTGLARATFLDLRDAGVKVSLISPGMVAAGAGLASPTGQSRPQELLAVDDVAAAVRFVVTSSPSCCPTEIQLQPLRSPWP